MAPTIEAGCVVLPAIKAGFVVILSLIVDKLDESKVLKSEVEGAEMLTTVVEEAAVLATVAVEVTGRSQILYRYSVQLLVILLYTCEVTLSAIQGVSAMVGLVKLTPEKRHKRIVSPIVVLNLNFEHSVSVLK